MTKDDTPYDKWLEEFERIMDHDPMSRGMTNRRDPREYYDSGYHICIAYWDELDRLDSNFWIDKGMPSDDGKA